jgi:membrane protease YdiL (CAAX protease family)
MASDDAVLGVPASGLRALFEGPPAYRPVTAWGPVAALAVTAVACLAPLALVMAGITLASATGIPPATIDDLVDGLSSFATPGGIAVMAFSQLLSLGIVWRAAGRGGLRQQTLRLADPKPAWSTAVGAGILLIAVSGAVELILYNLLGFELFGDTKWLMEGLNSSIGWAVAIVAVVLAPLWEELAFRGFLLSALARSRLGFWPAAVISTALWTLLHWGYSYAGLMSVFVAGLLLSWLMQRLGSMRVVVVAHALANTFALAAAWLFAPG